MNTIKEIKKAHRKQLLDYLREKNIKGGAKLEYKQLVETVIEVHKNKETIIGVGRPKVPVHLRTRKVNYGTAVRVSLETHRLILRIQKANPSIGTQNDIIHKALKHAHSI